MTVSVHDKLLDAGYAHTGHNEAGQRYRKAPFTVYHSGSLLIFCRDGGMTRPFREDRLLFFTVADMEKQTSMLLNSRTGREDRSNYDIGNKLFTRGSV